MTTPDDGGPAFPTFPFTRTLRHNLFRSSADAIGAWLDSPDLVIVAQHGDLPISLPPLSVEGSYEGADDVAPTGIPFVHDAGESADIPILAEQVLTTGSETPLRPRWDQDRRQLWVGDDLIKHFKVPAESGIRTGGVRKRRAGHLVLTIRFRLN